MALSCLTRVGLGDVKYSHTRYKLRRCDSRDRVWTLFSLRGRKTKENAYPRGRPSLSFSPFPSHIPLRPLMQIAPLAFNHASRESLPAGFDRIFPASGLVRNSTCASRAPLSRTRTRKSCSRGQTRRYTATYEAAKYKRARER